MVTFLIVKNRKIDILFFKKERKYTKDERKNKKNERTMRNNENTRNKT